MEVRQLSVYHLRKFTKPAEKQFEKAEEFLKGVKDAKKIAWYLKDRNICKQENSDKEMSLDEWINEWSSKYPVATRTVLYQALIFAGEHKLAKEIKGERKYNASLVSPIT